MMGLFGLGKKKEKRIQEADLKSKEGLKKLLGDQLKPGIKIEGDVETSHLETPAEKENIKPEEKIEKPKIKEGNETLKKAEKLVDMGKTGNPQEQYHSGFIKNYYKKMEKEGGYKPYIEEVIKETEENLPELKKEIEEQEKATFSFSRLEHTNPEEYRKQKEESRLKEELETKENWTEEDEKTLNELLASLESAENRLKEIDAEIEKAKIKEKEPIKSETFEEEEQPEINEAYEKNPSLECEEEIKQKEDYIKKLKFWNFLEKKRQKWNLEYLKRKLEEIKEEIKEIDLDKKEKPFLYYAFEKSANPILLYNNKDKKSGLLDLRKINKEWVEITYNFLKETGKNEGFFEFNIYGFIKIIKNVNEIQGDEGKGINSYSENAIYKIVGPNGEIIADDIKGYNETDRIYTEKTEEYKKKLEKQFLEENK